MTARKGRNFLPLKVWQGGLHQGTALFRGVPGAGGWLNVFFVPLNEPLVA